LVRAADLEVYDLSRPPELAEAVALIEKCRDTPVDFADATLVLLAEGLEVYDILTLDRRGFSVFRTRRKQPLRLVLDSV
jgi:predicted nucleic acid-binding protein